MTKSSHDQPRSTILNGICPYFTMFPLDFPLSILEEAAQGDWVIDPFCGRGTTNYASRVLGLPSIGIDSSPVAVAMARAKIANTTPARILQAAKHLLDEIQEPQNMPEGEFWQWAYHPDVLKTLCRFREGLLANCSSPARIALRAVIMGALHGPQAKTKDTYFSNQSPRTYAPKPNYAVKFWTKHELHPKHVNVLTIINDRALRYYAKEPRTAVGKVLQADSRNISHFHWLKRGKKINWVITSPPYYGMRTYIPDQWLRGWFLGGPDTVDYTNECQLQHSSPEEFANQLKQVWLNVAFVATDDAKMVVRFGAINDRKADPMVIIRESLEHSGWSIDRIEDAGTASDGKRQAEQFKKQKDYAITEHDVWAVRCQ